MSPIWGVSTWVWPSFSPDRRRHAPPVWTPHLQNRLFCGKPLPPTIWPIICSSAMLQMSPVAKTFGDERPLYFTSDFFQLVQRLAAISATVHVSLTTRLLSWWIQADPEFCFSGSCSYRDAYTALTNTSPTFNAILFSPKYHRAASTRWKSIVATEKIEVVAWQGIRRETFVRFYMWRVSAFGFYKIACVHGTCERFTFILNYEAVMSAGFVLTAILKNDVYCSFCLYCQDLVSCNK